MEDVKVSVVMFTYNHARYVQQAIEGVLMQKTDFRYELIIHDDASTDSTQDIIREYEEKYPERIRVIYEVENQYSKRIAFGLKYVYPICKGKYIAICEGDDYWIDENKLQQQADFLDQNQEYVAIGGNVKLIGEDGELLKDDEHDLSYSYTYTNMKDHDYTREEFEKSLLFGQTCTVMYINYWNNLPKEIYRILENKKSRTGDQLRCAILFCRGKIRCSSNLYGAYRKSWTNDSYTARTEGTNKCRNQLYDIKEKENILSYYGVAVNYKKQYLGMCANALRWVVLEPSTDNKDIFKEVFKNTPYKFSLVFHLPPRYIKYLLISIKQHLAIGSKEG